jgi:phage tail sheath protein FI
MVNVLDVATKSPGVYVFEEPSAVKAIGGVSTSTAGFIGVFLRPAEGLGTSPTPDKEPIMVTSATDTFPLKWYPIEPQDNVSVPVTSTLAATNYTVVEADKKVTLTSAPPSGARYTVSYEVSGAEWTDKDLAPVAKVLSLTKTPDPDTVKVMVKTTETATLGNDDTNKKGQVKFTRELPQDSTFEISYPVTAPEGEPILFTNFTEFKQKFGNFDGTATAANYLRHAVFGFFNNGGSRCYVIWVSDSKTITNALDAFAAIDEIALVAAPGSAVGDDLANHCATKEGIYYRFAILDGPSTESDLTKLTKTSTDKGEMPTRSDYAAWYFPWIKVADRTKKEDGTLMAPDGVLEVPPSGHLAGIYARVDSQRGVHKAPANEPIRGAVNVTQQVSKVQQDGLNKEGVNCIRVLNNQVLVWGARTLAPSDKPELKYVNVRRTLLFLRKSIDLSTQWVVFEPNTRALWKKIVRNVDAFLTDVWRSGALFGDTPQEAFYVHCDDGTNPRSQRELGLVVTEIGVAIARPAEFVVFRISQFTAPA